MAQIDVDHGLKKKPKVSCQQANMATGSDLRFLEKRLLGLISVCFHEISSLLYRYRVKGDIYLVGSNLNLHNTLEITGFQTGS